MPFKLIYIMSTHFKSLHHSSFFTTLFLHQLPLTSSPSVTLLTAIATIEMASSFLDQESLVADKLTNEIFSLLENKFLFGSHDCSHLFTGKSDTLDKTLLGDFKKIDAGKVRILSIDGNGSTEGILAAQSLAFLEAFLCQKSGNPDAQIADFFDVATGSGVGGILAALLFTKGKEGRAIFKASEALQFILKNRGKLSLSTSKGTFSRLFSPSKTNKKFGQIFGETTLKDTIKPVLISCYDLSSRAPFLFSRTDAWENDSYDFKMSDVCTAALADPKLAGTFAMSSIDRQTRIAAVDGGVAMNNPTAAAITHVLNNKKEFPFCDSVEDLLVLSLGNGVSDSSCAPNFVKIGGEAASDMTDEAVSMAFGASYNSNYVRIQANGSNASKGKNLLDTAEKMLTQKSIESILFRGKKVVAQTNSDKLEWFAKELVKENERRRSSIFPTVMFKHSSPRTSSATVSTISSY